MDCQTTRKRDVASKTHLNEFAYREDSTVAVLYKNAHTVAYELVHILWCEWATAFNLTLDEC